VKRMSKELMNTTRRDALTLVGAAAAARVLTGAGKALAQPQRRLGSATKTMFWSAIVTPCDRNRNFDPAAMRDIIAFQKANGADGLVILGTTGEFPSFSMAERKQIAEVAGKNKNGMNIIVNPGTPNLSETIELAKHAADTGADGLLVIPPFYYNDPPLDGLVRYYSGLFDAVQLPINLYHIPGTSEVPISLDLLSALKHYPHLAGIKDSSGDMAGFSAFVKAFPELNMRTGGGDLTLVHALDNGMGAILAEGNLFCKMIADIFAAKRAGRDYKPAYDKFTQAMQLMGPAVWNIGLMKYAATLQMGMPQSFQRFPNPDPSAAQMAAIREAVAKIKALG